LGSDDGGAYDAAAFDDGGGRFIAGGFDCEEAGAVFLSKSFYFIRDRFFPGWRYIVHRALLFNRFLTLPVIQGDGEGNAKGRNPSFFLEKKKKAKKNLLGKASLEKNNEI